LSSTLGAGDTTVTGTLDSTGNFEVGPSTGRLFTVAGGTGNTVVSGTLGATGATTLSSTLGAGDTTVTGTLDSTGNFEVGPSTGRLFTVDASSGATAVTGSLDVSAATTLAGAALSGDITMSNAAAAITHGGTTGLAITSTGGYVDVEAVRFTGLNLGTATVGTVLSLADTGAGVTGTLDSTGNFAVGSAGVGGFTVTASNGNTVVPGTLEVTDATTMSSDLTVGLLGELRKL